MGISLHSFPLTARKTVPNKPKKPRNFPEKKVIFSYNFATKKIPTDNLQGKTYARTIAFNLSRMGQNGTENGLCIQAPLLALVPVPNLAVEEVDINFQMEVTSASKSVAEGTGDEQGLRVCGKVSSQAGNTRESNQSAKYQIQVKARKQDTPEGLSRILDILAQSVNPETEQHTGGTE